MNKENKHSKDELKEIAPRLSQLPKSNPYRTPDKYFEQFEEKILETIREQDIPAPKTAQPSAFERLLDKLTGTLFRPRMALALVAVFVVALVGGHLLKAPAIGPAQHFGDNELELALNSLDEGTLEAYVYHNIDEFDQTLFASAIGEDVDASIFDGVDQGDLEDYIESESTFFNDLDESSILEELL